MYVCTCIAQHATEIDSTEFPPVLAVGKGRRPVLQQQLHTPHTVLLYGFKQKGGVKCRFGTQVRPPTNHKVIKLDAKM